MIATRIAHAPDAARRLRAIGAAHVRTSAEDTIHDRAAVVGELADPITAAAGAARLRADGFIALLRPTGGPQLVRWSQDSAPVTFDARLSVCVAWSEHDTAHLAGLVQLGPGGFGDGTHPTTAMLIGELLDRLHGGERVLDVGCGSGVLGLAALRLGAARLVAVDLKPEALEATRRNAALNGFGARLDADATRLGDVDGAFDVIVANVGRGAVVELAPHLLRLLSPDGWLALSGFSPQQVELVAGFLPSLAIAACHTMGEWAAVTLVRR